jgi:hypothetical protein
MSQGISQYTLLVLLLFCMHCLLSTFYLTILLVLTSWDPLSILASIGQIRNRELIGTLFPSSPPSGKSGTGNSSTICSYLISYTHTTSENSTHGIIPKVNLLTSLFNLLDLLGGKFKLPKFRVTFNPLFILGGSNGNNTRLDSPPQ